MIKIWFDGFCDGNPSGKCGIGAIIEKNEEVIHTFSRYLGEGADMTNNVAEYEALRNALLYLKYNDYADDEIIAYGDSKIVVEQMSGNWKIKKGIYKERALKTKELLKSFPNISFCWIPREQNTRADELSMKGVALG